MSNPFSLAPYALAASGSAIGGVSMSTLVAAGFTLLQRSAPLVRAMATSRPALLLSPSAATLTALAACDGHVALMLDPGTPNHVLAQQLQSAGIGVLFTVSTIADRLSKAMLDALVIVLLDDIPKQARVRLPGAGKPEAEQPVDLGSHVGLRVVGLADAALSDDALASWFVDGHEVTVSHAETWSGLGPLAWLRNV